MVIRPRAEQEALNYQDVLRYIRFIAGQPKFKLTEHIVKRINHITLQGIPEFSQVRGRYKAVPVGVPPHLPGADPREVSRLMSELVAETNSLLAIAKSDDPANADLHPVNIAAMVMWRLLNIHPFHEGNGRTSRAIATLILMIHGYIGIPTDNRFRPVKTLEWFFDQRRGHYGNCLHQADQENHNPWLKLFSDAVTATMTVIRTDKLNLGDSNTASD